MKRIILISLIGFISLSSIAQKDTNVFRKLDQIEKTINEISQRPIKINDSLLVSTDNFKKLTNTLEKDKSIWGYILPSIIAILVVLISTGGAIYLGIRQIKIQTTNSEEQIRSQEAQAQDNLRVAREQIQETSRMTLAQVRANNISQARIKWIQDLRNELSQYNGEVAIINYYLQDVVDLMKKGDKTNAEKLYIEQVERIKNARQYAFKIKLFLNKDEADHKKLEDLIDKYYKTALENYSTVKSDFNSISNDILEVSRKVLKDAWAQAKNEGN
jgi:hypothetical protein